MSLATSPRRPGARLFLAVIVALGVAGAATEAQAQTAASSPAPAKKQSAWRDKLFVGGGVGFGFGDVDFVSLEPLIGYRLHPQVSIGMNLIYRWSSYEAYGSDIDTSDYGARGFVQYYPVPMFFLQGEYEYLDYEYILSDLSTGRDEASSILAGGGISQPLGGNGSFYASALYNFSYDDNDAYSPYDSPWVIRVGAAVGF